MESMDDREFDRKIKAKFERLESPLPQGLWNAIEQELDAAEKNIAITKGNNEDVKLFAELSTTNNPKAIGRLKRIVLTYGSIAALLFIVFSFWKFDETPVIYLENNQESRLVESEIVTKKNPGENKIALKYARSEPATLPIPNQKTTGTSEKVRTKAIYANLKNIKTPVSIVDSREGILGEQGDPFEVVELDLALLENSKGMELNGIVQEVQESGVLPSVGRTEDIDQDMYPIYAEVKRSNNKKIGVSTVLNFLAKGFSGEDGNSIEFSEDEEGILQWDIKSNLARGPK